jgi:uncharacterized protein
MQNIRVKPSGAKGRGVFAEKRFVLGETVEAVPVVVLPDPQYEFLEQTSLKDYYFYWTDESVALGFGCSSFYNYSKAPNAELKRDVEHGIMRVVARRTIYPGDEITVTYHCEPWFEVVD